MFPPALRTSYSMPDTMRDNMKKLSQIFSDDIDISLRPTEKTLQMSQLTYDNEEKYGFAYSEEEMAKMNFFNVNAFWHIGISDPYPDESTIVEAQNQLLGDEEFTLEKLVYPKQRYAKGVIPMQIYIPSKQVMLKIIRACIGCDEVGDLWFNRKTPITKISSESTTPLKSRRGTIIKKKKI